MDSLFRQATLTVDVPSYKVSVNPEYDENFKRYAKNVNEAVNSINSILNDITMFLSLQQKSSIVNIIQNDTPQKLYLPINAVYNSGMWKQANTNISSWAVRMDVTDSSGYFTLLHANPNTPTGDDSNFWTEVKKINTDGVWA